MAEIIFRTQTGPFLEAPQWLVERQPEGVTDPMVVRFRKVGKRGNTLLDQNARWTARGWDSKRWHPTPPKVPKWLLEKVLTHLTTMEVNHG
jgi:hypothetical protein